MRRDKRYVVEDVLGALDQLDGCNVRDVLLDTHLLVPFMYTPTTSTLVSAEEECRSTARALALLLNMRNW